MSLTNLTKNGVEFKWKEPQEAVFVKLKTALVKAPILAMFDPGAITTEVHADASSVGVEAMLLQRKDKGSALRLVYSISKKLNEAESKYHSGKLELLTVVWAVDKWRHFLLGIKFTIINDCQALIF